MHHGESPNGLVENEARWCTRSQGIALVTAMTNREIVNSTNEMMFKVVFMTIHVRGDLILLHERNKLGLQAEPFGLQRISFRIRVNVVVAGYHQNVGRTCRQRVFHPLKCWLPDELDLNRVNEPIDLAGARFGFRTQGRGVDNNNLESFARAWDVLSTSVLVVRKRPAVVSTLFVVINFSLGRLRTVIVIVPHDRIPWDVSVRCRVDGPVIVYPQRVRGILHSNFIKVVTKKAKESRFHHGGECLDLRGDLLLFKSHSTLLFVCGHVLPPVAPEKGIEAITCSDHVTGGVAASYIAACSDIRGVARRLV